MCQPLTLEWELLDGKGSPGLTFISLSPITIPLTPNQSLVSNQCSGKVYGVLGWKPRLAAKLPAFWVEGETGHSFSFPLTPFLTCQLLLLTVLGLGGHGRENTLPPLLWGLMLLQTFIVKVPFHYNSSFLSLVVKTPDSPTINLILALGGYK